MLIGGRRWLADAISYLPSPYSTLMDVSLPIRRPLTAAG